jgi:hypothetical protein
MKLKTSMFALAVGAVVVAACAVAAPAVKNYYCKYCGLKSSSIASLTSSKCQRHPDGAQKGRHEPAL